MRLAVWCTSYFKEFGGAEKVVNDLVNRFAAMGINTLLIANKVRDHHYNNSYYEPLDTRIHIYQDTFVNPFDSIHRPLRFLSSLFRYSKAAFRLAVFLRKQRPDILHLHFVSFDVFLLVLYRFLFRCKLILTFTGSDVELAIRNRVARFKVKFALRFADGTTAVSEDLCNKIKTQYSYSKILYIPNGINPDEIRQSAALSSSHLTNDQFVYCGRLIGVKRVPFLVEAFYECIKKGCRKDLYIVGDGEDSRAIKKLIERLNIEDRVILAGALAHSEVLSIIRGSRCLILSSASEGCPLVALEALALGKPVIAPEVGGLGEILIHGVNGYLYAPDRKDLLCELILMMSEPSEYEHPKAGAITVLNEKFSFNSVIDRYLNVYESVSGLSVRS